jgi:hypothetical protein
VDQYVLAVYDFDIRFTFIVAGWPGSVHDTRVFNEVLIKYVDKFPFSPEGKKYQTSSLFVISTTLLITFVTYVYEIITLLTRRILRKKVSFHRTRERNII